MNLLNPGIYVLGFYNPGGSAKAFMSGNDISPSSTLEKTVLTRGVSSGGGVVQLNYKWELNLQFARQEAFEDLLAFPSNQGTGLEIWKTNGFVTWRNLTDVHVDEAVITDPESEDYPYTARMTFTGPDPYIRENLNYLAPWNGFEERPWTIEGAYDSLSFTSGVQTINTLATGEVDVYTDIYTPFRDTTDSVVPFTNYSFWGDFSKLHIGADIRMYRVAYDESDQATTTVFGSIITSTGYQELIAVTPSSSTLKYRVGFLIENITSASDVRFRTPNIVTERAQNSTSLTSEFVNY